MVAAFYTLDVIIPSFRFRENAGNLVRIASLQAPAHWTVNVHVIGDNPLETVPPLLQEYISSGKIHFCQNTHNRGLNYTRNKGIAVSSGAWILILDDDIIPDPGLLVAYTRAIENRPDAMGFAGVVEFPEPGSSFAKALVISGYTYFFSLPRFKEKLGWTTGANFVLNREKLGDIRFNEAFRKDEGGDEVELAIRLQQKTGDRFSSVPEATVLHPWWNNGRPDYKRAAAYSRGNLRLLQLHPKFTELRFLNSVELLVLMIVLSPVLWWMGVSLFSLLLYAACIIVVDITAHLLRIRKENGAVPVRVAAYTWLLKKAEQAGFLHACIRAGEWTAMYKRFDMELREKQKHFHTNRWLWLKIAGFVLSAILIRFI